MEKSLQFIFTLELGLTDASKSNSTHCWIVFLKYISPLKNISFAMQSMAMEAAYKIFFCDICTPTPSIVLDHDKVMTVNKDAITDRPVHTNKLYTWKADPCLWVTVFQTNVGSLALVHCTGDVCYINKCFALDNRIPYNSIFSAQIVFDQNVLTNSIHPRIMIFDMLQWGNDSLLHLSPVERYAMLRDKGFNCRWTPAMHIQWAGNGLSAIEFCKSGNLPHSIDHVVEYDQVNAYCLHAVECKPNVKHTQ